MLKNRSSKSRMFAATVAVAALALTGCSVKDNAAEPAGKPSTSASQSSAAASEPQLFSYQFPHGMVNAWEGGDILAATPINAIVAVPGTPGPHPVVTILQATLPTCVWAEKEKALTKEALLVDFAEACTEGPVELSSGTVGQDYFRAPASYGYLAKALANRGFAVVVPDLGGAGQLWTTETSQNDMTQNVMALHHKLLSDLNDGKDFGLPWASKVKGAFDLSQQYLVGHSSGAGLVTTLGQGDTVEGLRGVVAVEPAWQHTESDAPKVPTLVVGGQCDEQVGIKPVLKYAAKMGKAAPSVPVITAQMDETTHLDLITGGVGGVTGVFFEPAKGTCGRGGGKVAPAHDQQAQLAELVADFLDQVKADKTAFELGVGDVVPVQLNSLNEAATVKPMKVSELPEIVDPHSFTFDKSTVALAPAPKKTDWGGKEADEAMPTS